MLGQLHSEENVSGTGVQAATYNRLLILNEEGEFETLLITDHELVRLRKRSDKNSEDVVIPGFIDQLHRALVELFNI